MALTKELARRDARAVLDEYWDGLFPVDPARIAMIFGIEVVTADLGETSGVLIKDEQGPTTIYLNSLEPASRQNYTCGHELGHFIDRRNKGDKEYSFADIRGQVWDDDDAHEWYAEHFSSNLLMPMPEFERIVDRERSVSRLARIFGVSVTALRTRARLLGIELP